MAAAGSLASATSSRVDSASKHIQACKVNTDYMLSLVEGTCDNGSMELQQNKMKYCMHKDDVVIGIGRCKYGSSINQSTCRKKAYPSVVTTLGRMSDFARRWLAMHNFLTTNPGIMDFMLHQLEHAQRHNASGFQMYNIGISQIKNAMEHYFVGISLGMAYAHPNSGDTVASVMIGGLRTVLNGAFQVHTNDLLMFYTDDELPLFEESGARIDRGIMNTADVKALFGHVMRFCADGTVPNGLNGFNNDTDDTSRPAKKFRNGSKDSKMFAYYDRGNGNYSKNNPQKINVFRIKPYIVSKHLDGATGLPQNFPCDKNRIFGRAISNAQPYTMLDIQLSRQAI